MLESLFKKVAGLKATQYRFFPVNIGNFLSTAFFIVVAPMIASDSPTAVQYSQLGCLFFDFASMYFYLNQKFTQNVAEIIIC